MADRPFEAVPVDGWDRTFARARAERLMRESKRLDIKVTGSTEYLAWTVERARQQMPGVTLITAERVRDCLPIGLLEGR